MGPFALKSGLLSRKRAGVARFDLDEAAFFFAGLPLVDLRLGLRVAMLFSLLGYWDRKILVPV